MEDGKAVEALSKETVVLKNMVELGNGRKVQQLVGHLLLVEAAQMDH